MRIAILADPVDNQDAGVHVYTVQMIHSLLANNTEHEYILIRQKRDDRFGKVRQIIVPNTSLPIGFASLRLFFIIPLLCVFYKVDAVIEPAHFGPFNLPKRIKRITVIHDLTPLLFPEMHRWHSRVLQQIFLKGILKRTDLIIANSKNTEKDLHRVFPFTKSKTLMLYPGVEKIFKPDANTEVVAKYKLQQPYFLSVGTIEPRKNLDVLVQGFDLFLSRNADCKYQLVIAGGKGWKYERFFELLETLPHRHRVSLIGYVDRQDLPAIYSMSGALFYLSGYEGFGFPVAEAMACGVPVVCSIRSSLAEVGGDAAMYCQEITKEAVAEKMEAFFIQQTDFNKLEERGRLQAAHFSWDTFGRDFTLRLHTLLG